LDGGSDSDNENDRNGEGSSRNGANWEVGQIRGMDGEGTMFDNGGTGMEVTADVRGHRRQCRRERVSARAP
jgi:hypothetical protein